MTFSIFPKIQTLFWNSQNSDFILNISEFLIFTEHLRIVIFFQNVYLYYTFQHELYVYCTLCLLISSYRHVTCSASNKSRTQRWVIIPVNELTRLTSRQGYCAGCCIVGVVAERRQWAHWLWEQTPCCERLWGLCMITKASLMFCPLSPPAVWLTWCLSFCFPPFRRRSLFAFLTLLPSCLWTDYLLAFYINPW